MNATAPLPVVVRQVRETLTAIVAKEDQGAADWIKQVRERRAAEPSVVVVGETNRGKSSLVNALLASKGLSPVDANVATSTYLVFGHDEQWHARACYPGKMEPVEFNLAELPNWVSMRHELPAGALPPRYVEVNGPVPLLERMRVVDTPGVGGLNSMHGELAKEAAAAATALLFVVDASAPFTAGELAFLAEFGEKVETVVFALTKTDAFRGWRQVMEADQKLLAQYAPRFADATFYPVSARMFEMAAGAPNQDAAAMLRERSGVAELQMVLQQLVVGRSAMLVEANSLRAVDTALAGIEVKVRGEQRALSAGADEAEALRARKEELTTARRSASRGWQVKLRGEVQRARIETNHEVSRQMRDLQTWFRQAIESADKEKLAALPQEVDAALQLVSGRLSEGLAARLGQAADATLAELFTPEELETFRAQLARADTSPIMLRPPERRSPTAEDKLLVFMGMSGGFGVARVAALPLAGLAVLNPFILPATIVLGLGAGWWMARTRKHAAEKQHMKQWLSDALADARSTLDQLVSQQLIDAEQALTLGLDDAVVRRIDSIESELREVDRTLKLDAAEKTRRLDAANKRLAEAKAGRERVAGLLSDIRALRDNG